MSRRGMKSTNEGKSRTSEKEMGVTKMQRLPESPALSTAQAMALSCGRTYRKAIKGIFDNRELVLNEVNDGELVQGTVKGVSSEVLSQKILSSVRAVYGMGLMGNGEAVNYEGLRTSAEFQAFQADVQMLWWVDPMEMDVRARKAFFLNIYNALVIHGIIVGGKPETATERMHFYSRTAYAIGGRLFTLNDIEHGILRSNRMSWQPIPVKPFSEYDTRLKCAVPLDPRIHFALNCGAKGCPNLRFYESENLDEALDLATRAFLRDVYIDEANGMVVVSSIFSWYLGDFADDHGGLLRWIFPFLTAENQQRLSALSEFMAKNGYGEVVVGFGTYDWSVNE
uniref:DUF547 domain-containing protein n=1 Tax=Rhodosorus marinus TaxID=101924 RepID=A0A7S2ZK11_9RHOD|mmetsp:Transcript_22229/g.89799  ORF Transcript_22229/g.89799 Transcript_22229/m.89799 type:complete len:339 (+) Transcript_22229:165-1181(+)|eukprot:CAMPEP_0113956142 /NCGR_PEP_ID=MMETSP0011_2-20120614/1866_1 /TAXON_ID=101924 /ORGANISM="Rhodosorus marinus" /LENGTH=338 /DNA_ID=CAMNT_0000966193 /DNA_START=92 /DNA_END=1108 /DNA_ORIENTATION=- /assembly_acc=CAM_ASM_000156